MTRTRTSRTHRDAVLGRIENDGVHWSGGRAVRAHARRAICGRLSALSPPAPPLAQARCGQEAASPRRVRRAAPPRSQRAPRGEEAAAAGWGHFVSAIAAVERQDGGGGRVGTGGCRDPAEPAGLALPFPSPLAAPWRPPLTSPEGAGSRAVPGRGTGQSRGAGRPPEGPGPS